MKHKVSELEGALLDAAVAKAEGRDDFWWSESRQAFIYQAGPQHHAQLPSMSEWANAGPIIERVKIDISSPDEWTDDLRWYAGIYESKTLSGTRMMYEQRGDTPLVAAMRAYVASKFGDEVEL